MPGIVRGMGSAGAAANIRHLAGRRDPEFHNSANLRNLKPQTSLAIDRSTAVFFKSGYNIVLTSVYREHDEDSFSLHPFGYAVDIDTTHSLSYSEWDRLRGEIQKQLGSQYQVIAHDAGSGWHIHIEYDPQHDDEWKEFKDEMRREWREHVHELG